MSEFLTPYYEAAQREARAREVSLPFRELEWMIAELPERSGFAEALATGDGVAIIAEHKRKSPSIGEIHHGSGVTWTAEQYQKGGAVAISILTQATHFGGRVEDLTEARQAIDLPILRKDFIGTEYQVYQARAFGADAVLLIVGGLSDSKLRSLYESAGDIGLDCLVEVHDEEELYRALTISPRLLGINNRNLDTMQVDLNTTRELIEAIPDSVTVVAESGYSVKQPQHMMELRGLGVDAVLIGGTLMCEEEPAQALKSWLAS